jgi:hypothetical protein
MNEALLHYLWKNVLFKPESLISTDREPVMVIHPGIHNHNSGPDFLEAKLKIGNTIWAGNVELHMRTSDWHKHNHGNDPAYRNIILHVVFEDDEPLGGASFSTLELKHYIEQSVIDRYQKLMSLERAIPCAGQLQHISELTWSNWLDRMLAERWEQKLDEWHLLWLQAGKDWRTLLYYRLAANFGFHVNRDAFLELALSIPLNVLVKHRNNLMQTEALLFGQSGLLHAGDQDEYTLALEKEYHFLRRKYQLTPIVAHRWKFMRLRPFNFPTIRIAQFAMMVHKSIELFAQLMEITKATELIPLLDIHASEYWDDHYRFGETADEKQAKHLGKDAVLNIMINTVAPMQYLYARLQGKSSLHENSINLLQSIKPEHNKIIGEWKNMGVQPKDAAQSQALLQLFNQYCTNKNCLNCAVGNRLVRKG